jgi:hypothetical protein
MLLLYEHQTRWVFLVALSAFASTAEPPPCPCPRGCFSRGCVLRAAPALSAVRDGGDAVSLLQTMAGGTFDSSALVLTACMGFAEVESSLLQTLAAAHRPQVRLTQGPGERGKGGGRGTGGRRESAWLLPCGTGPEAPLCLHNYASCCNGLNWGFLTCRMPRRPPVPDTSHCASSPVVPHLHPLFSHPLCQAAPLPSCCSPQVVAEALRRQAEREAVLREPPLGEGDLHAGSPSGAEASTSGKGEATPGSLARGMSKLWRAKTEATAASAAAPSSRPTTPEHAEAQMEEQGSQVDDLRAQVGAKRARRTADATLGYKMPVSLGMLLARARRISPLLLEEVNPHFVKMSKLRL